MHEFTSVDRRTVLRGVGSLAVVGSIAGCSTDGGDDGGDGGSDGGSGDGGSGGFTPPQEATDYLSDVPNYDSFEDMTGESSVTISVGAEPNNNWSYDPPAIRVSSGTAVTWEWTGNGGAHNVIDEDGAFESELVDEEGHTFEYTFDSTGVSRYYCNPHKSAGMKGVVIVE